MALTADEEEKIRALLAKEDAQKKKSVLSSLQTFANWVETIAKIVAAIDALKPLFLYLCKLILGV